MRRSLVVSLALLALVNAPAVAQTCMGLPSFSSGSVQVTGSGNFTDGVDSFGGSLGYGLPGSVFGSVEVATTSIEAFDGSSFDLGANLGYQLAIGRSKQTQLCPVASFGIGMGPKDIFGSGVDRSGQGATFGFGLGTSMRASPQMQIVPAIGLGLAYAKEKLEDQGGNSIDGSDTFGLAQFGVGLVLNSNIALRPSVSIPLGLDGSDPTIGVTLGIHFGRKR